MRFEWYVEKWLRGEYIDRTPHAMTKSEAEQLALMTRDMPGLEAYEFKVVHRKDLQHAA